MSCNGCRVLRKGCNDNCMLRSCLKWIDCPEAQSHATLFVAKFFGRGDLMSFISSVPENQRQALFRSLLLEACGRTVNPVNGALGLLWSGNWHVCEAAMNTILAGSAIRPLPNFSPGAMPVPVPDESSESCYLDGCDLRSVFSSQQTPVMHDFPFGEGIEGKPIHHPKLKRSTGLTLSSDDTQEHADMSGSLSRSSLGNDNKKPLNLFV